MDVNAINNVFNNPTSMNSKRRKIQGMLINHHQHLPYTFMIKTGLLMNFVLLLSCCFLILVVVEAQVSWTPIYVDTSNQVDLWTIKERGCGCPEDPSSKACACCVKPGGCLCTFHYNKCAQCGLQDVCQRFCNVTISSWKVASASGLSWVQLKSPSLQGPSSCWWRLESAPGQRIEIQIHRLISIGSYDNSTQRCSKGFVQFSAGDVILPSSQALQLCGDNSRFSPPIVIFADQGIATLYLRIEARSTRSQLLAYASFVSADDPVVGDPSRGGKQNFHSVCDWTYDNCWSHDCILTSPGYPGISPPYRKCRYFLSGNSTTNRLRLSFHTLSFLSSHNKCSNHHLAIWKLNDTTSSTNIKPNSHDINSIINSSPWLLLCEEIEGSVIDIDGTNSVILEYRSGSAISPYVHNGFRASVQFLQLPPSSLAISTSTTSTTTRTTTTTTTTMVPFVPVVVPTVDDDDEDEEEEELEDLKHENISHVHVHSSRPPPSTYNGFNNNKNNHKDLANVTLRPRYNNNNNNRNNYHQYTTSTSTSTTTTATTTTTTTTTMSPFNGRPRQYHHLNNYGGADVEGVYPINCGHIFDSELTRGHVFRLLIPKDLTLRPPPSNMMMRSFGTYLNGHGNGNGNGLGKPPLPPPGPFKCQIEFRGRYTDIVQFAGFNYKFRGSNCSTILEIYDMDIDRSLNQTDRLLGKLCGPNGHEVKRFTSSYSRLALIIWLFPDDEIFGTEFLEGAFRFHDESIEGTVKPMSSCEVVYYGVTSSSTGIVSGPPDSPLLLLSTFPLVCAYTFLPSLNQTVSLTLNGAGHDSVTIALPNSINYCRTICTSSGCGCEAKYTPLEQIDHLILLAGLSGATHVGCLCGYFKDILPLSFESHIPLTLVYHATKVGREFSYSIGYQFKNKITCSNFTIQPPSSSKRWKEILGPSVQYNNRHNGGKLHYTYFQCIWSIVIPTRYKLLIDFISEENENDCHTWNLTIWAGNDLAIDPSPNDLLYSFCPKDGRKEFQLPENIQYAFLKLVGVTTRPPQFDIRWRYIDIMLGSGFLTEKIITNECVSLLHSFRFINSLVVITMLIVTGHVILLGLLIHGNCRF